MRWTCEVRFLTRCIHKRSDVLDTSTDEVIAQPIKLHLSYRTRPMETRPKRSSSRRGQTSPETKKSKLHSEIPSHELLCTICHEYPEAKIFQCTNGHLLCSGCYERIHENLKFICPLCRVKLSRDHPSRNRFAENVLSMKLVPCGNEGCKENIAFGKRHVHAGKCPYKIVSCKYSLLGCEWTGVNNKKSEHEKECPTTKKSISKILRKVVEKEKKRSLEEKLMKDKYCGQEKVIELLSGRAHDIVIRDVTLQRDEDEEDLELCSKTFMALGQAWEVALRACPSPGGKAAPGLVIRCVSRLRKNLKVTFFVLKGPFVEFDLIPSIHQAELLKKQPFQECVCPLFVDQKTGTQLLEAMSLRLRIGFVDRSQGISRWFTNENDDASSSDEDSGSDVASETGVSADDDDEEEDSGSESTSGESDSEEEDTNGFEE